MGNKHRSLYASRGLFYFKAFPAESKCLERSVYPGYNNRALTNSDGPGWAGTKPDPNQSLLTNITNNDFVRSILISSSERSTLRCLDVSDMGFKSVNGLVCNIVVR